MCSVPSETLGIIPSGGDRIWVWKSDMGQEAWRKKQASEQPKPMSLFIGSLDPKGPLVKWL